jgi:hypothetical protein
MKGYIKAKWGINVKLLYDQLREAFQEAWDTITSDELEDLITSMRTRCEAVIAAEGSYIRF